MRALLLLPDPSAAPDEWTRRSLELRNAGTLTGQCPECGAVNRDLGVDHREIHHAAIEHRHDCRCSDDRINRHLDRRGLSLPSAYIQVIAEVDR